MLFLDPRCRFWPLWVIAVLALVVISRQWLCLALAFGCVPIWLALKIRICLADRSARSKGVRP